jgi:mannose-6-phosphate isomerase-like protein (cupin superfamily)
MMVNNYNIVNKIWGHEVWIENNNQYCGKHMSVLPNRYCSVHYHKNKKETFYVIKGILILQHSKTTDLDRWYIGLVDSITLKVGDSFTLEPYTVHRFTSGTEESCEFIEISTYHDDLDSYRLIESY